MSASLIEFPVQPTKAIVKDATDDELARRAMTLIRPCALNRVNNAVVTAEEGILKGTMRDLVLESCATLSIPVELRSPSLDEIDEWSGAFITSTSRVIMPIQTFVYHVPAEGGGSARREKTLSSCSIVHALYRHMFKTVQSHATKVFD
ncbi:hypothetical protein DYB32_000826 [Aphanomyces invadans]|uniref:Uncharacterized protein n=1 Tax=Aphanomyces invadans TaxID=157072 RepID=A0A418B8U5_9STRA|nr:hypothetical protein DYB32_000826 [Aphanomyces invadans]